MCVFDSLKTFYLHLQFHNNAVDTRNFNAGARRSWGNLLEDFIFFLLLEMILTSSVSRFTRSSLKGLSTSKRFSTSLHYSPQFADFIPLTTASSGAKSFRPSFLLTEADLPLPPKYASYPIRKFSLEGLGLDTRSFINLVKPYYPSMEWDYYDVRREQIKRIMQKFEAMNLSSTDSSTLNDLTTSYYKGEKTFDELIASLPVKSIISEEFLSELNNILPFRKKAASTFHVRFNTNKSNNNPLNNNTNIIIERKINNEITQLVANGDIRSIPRKYPSLNNNLLNHSLFHSFLERTCLMVKDNDPSITEMDIVLWQTSLTPTKQQAADNSPEGIHQDGADYIVSALIIERENIEGAESIIYEDDKKSVLYQTVLLPGEGIFQADHNTPIWHTVTKVIVSDHMNNNVIHGKRNSLGFDFINVIRNT